MHFNWDINLTRWFDSRDAFEHPSILIFVESIGNTSFCSSNTIGVGWIAARSNRKKERKKFLCDIPIDIINVISLRSKKMITLLSSSLLFIFSSLFSYPLSFFFFSFLRRHRPQTAAVLLTTFTEAFLLTAEYMLEARV